jgi:hypothetical protein
VVQEPVHPRPVRVHRRGGGRRQRTRAAAAAAAAGSGATALTVARPPSKAAAPPARWRCSRGTSGASMAFVGEQCHGNQDCRSAFHYQQQRLNTVAKPSESYGPYVLIIVFQTSGDST